MCIPRVLDSRRFLLTVALLSFFPASLGTGLRMRTGIVIPIRSGITNSIGWLFIEVWIGFLIDRLLIISYNRLAVRALTRGEYVEVRESRVCLFGNGLFANHPLSCPIIIFRLLIAISFLFMNLGIDGLTLPQYQYVRLHSNVTVGGSCKNSTTNHVGWALAKCTRFDQNRVQFNVTAPVFNLNYGSPRNRYFVDAQSLRCMDGTETEKKKVLVSGRMIRGIQLRNSLHLNGYMYLIPEKSPIPTAGAVFKLSKVLAAKTRKPLLTDGKLSSFCSPRRKMAVMDGEPWQMSHSSLCFFFYKTNSSTYIFKGFTTNLFRRSLGIVAKIRFSDALIFYEGIHFNDTDFEVLAKDLLEVGEGLFGLLPSILDCRFDASTDGVGEKIRVTVGQLQATQVRFYSCVIAVLIVAFALFLGSIILCTYIYRDRDDIQHQVQLNTIDGLSRILANSSSRFPGATPNARARVFYSNNIHVTSSEWQRVYQFPSDPPD